MPKAGPIQYNFNAGQWSRLLEGRVDQERYGNACRTLKNFLPTIQGPATRRTGTRFVTEARGKSQLIDFEPRGEVGYILEFGDKYIRFFTNRGLVVVSSAPAWGSGTTYALDEYVTFGGEIYRSTEGGNLNNQPDVSSEWEQTDHLIVTTPYDEDDVEQIRWTQSVDVLYLAHPDYPPQKLQRFAADDFRLEEIEFEGGPFLEQNINQTVTVNASAATGDVTLTASSAIFESGHVGSLIELESADLSGATPWEAGKSVTSGELRRNDGKVYQAQTTATTGGAQPIHTSGDASDGAVTWRYIHDFVGVVRITGFTSGTQVSGTVTRRIPGDIAGTGNNTWRWALGAWSDVEGYPSTVQFFRERLCFAKDDVLDMSVSQDFENFAAREFGETVAENAIRIRIVSDQLPEIRWLSPQDSLLVGTTGGEFVVSEVTTQEPLGPDNVKASRQTQFGSANLRPAAIGEATLFVQRQNRKLRELAFNFERGEQGGFVANDMTVFADDITASGIRRIAYQAEPNSILWCVMNDGRLAGFSYSRQQQVTGWSEHVLGGFASACLCAVQVESIGVIPDPDAGRDDVWLVVKRRIDGQDVRYIEYLEREFDPITQKPFEAVYLDCSLTFNEEIPITDIDGDPVMVTAPSHGLSDGDRVILRRIRWVGGGGFLNERQFRVANATTNTFTLQTFNGQDVSETLPAYGFDGVVQKLVTTISGLEHLEGETVGVLLDGATHPDVTVSGGQITLQTEGATATIGYRYESDLETMRVEAGAAMGTAQGKLKRISEVVVRVDSSGVFQYGPSEQTLDFGIFRNALDNMNQPVPLLTGDQRLTWNKGHERAARMYFRADTGLPLTIVALMPEVDTQG